MQSRLFLLLFSFSITTVYGQTSYVTSNFTIKQIDSLLRLSEKLYTIYPDSAFRYAQQAYQATLTNLNPTLKARALRQKAVSLRMSGEYIEALKLNTEALYINQSLKNDTAIIINTNDIGDIYAQEGNYQWAIDQYNKALTHSKNINYQKGIARSLNDLGSINEAIGNLPRAIQYWKESMGVCKTLKHEYGLAIAQKNLSLAYNKQKQYSKALFYARKAITIFAKSNHYPRYVASLVVISEIYQAVHEKDSAIYYAKKALNIGKYHKDTHKEALAAINMGAVYFENTATRNEAKKFFHHGFWTAKKGKHQRLAQLAAEKLYVYYKEEQKDSALFYHEILMNVKDSLLDIEKNRQIAGLQLSYELDTKHKELAYKEEIIKDQQIITTSLIIFSSIITILAISFYYQQRKLNKQNITLGSQNEKIGVQAEQMLQLNQLKDRLFSIISHDLRAPLRNLQGTIDLLNTEGALTHEEIQELSWSIHQQTENLLMVLDNLLLWSISQMKGQGQPSPTKVHLWTNIAESISFLGNIASNKQIRLINDTDTRHHVYVDNNHLQVIIRNLLANAIKFTNNGGFVKFYSQQASSDTIKIFIEDNGLGMSEEQVNKLFKISTHFSTQGTQAEKGTGIGLLLVHEFVVQSGGQITVQSRLKQGTVFCVELKIAPI